MAKIAKYKIMAKVVREDGEVIVHLNEDERTELSQSPVSAVDMAVITKISKELSDYNALQMEMAKKALLPNETETEVTIIFKYLED